MLKYRKLICFLILFFSPFCLKSSYCQTVDSLTFRLNTRLSFYSFEKSTEILLHVPQSHVYNNISVTLKINYDTVGLWNGKPGKNILRLPVNINLSPGKYRITAYISVSGRNLKYLASADYIILKYKPNEVKTDRLTGGLIVNKRQFFPFGFYCYSPVYATLPEEEAVKGFNMISPYQKILPETFCERKSYMDRCAALGMKVHYNILSVSGGGGVSSIIEGLTGNEKKELLLNEIAAFRDHPALLAWYIADEPNEKVISPDSLLKIYKIIKENDPWHPVSIVFMAPFTSSLKYAGTMDIVMADPYPVPDSPILNVGNVAASLSSEFKGEKPVWIVPQAFGGGEWWSREPSLQEIRSMTYQSIIKGARGIQYFVRQGLNLFPKSTGTWNECGRMAVEVAEMTPWLLSDEETIPVNTGSQNIIASSSVKKGQLMVIAANKANNPQRAEFTVSRPFSGRVKVLYENRNVVMSSGYFTDQLSAFGTQVYLIDLKPRKDTLKFWKYNLIKDPGFEDISSPGVPASCYARHSGDRGATYFLDSREQIEGNHSVRLITPKEKGSIKLRLFPFNVWNGATYMISVWAKADPVQRSAAGTRRKETQYFEISLGDFGTTRFFPDSTWQQFVTFIKIPYKNDLPPKTNIILQMPSAGVAWFDLLQAAECVDINRSINPELQCDWFYQCY